MSSCLILDYSWFNLWSKDPQPVVITDLFDLGNKLSLHIYFSHNLYSQDDWLDDPGVISHCLSVSFIQFVIVSHLLCVIHETKFKVATTFDSPFFPLQNNRPVFV